MATLKIKDAAGDDVYLSVTGSGTEADPYVTKSAITAPLDSDGEAMLVLDHAYEEIHEGKSFVHTGYQAMGNGVDYLIHLTAPDTTKRIHLELFVRASLETNVSIYEAPTGVTGGSDKTPVNRNRNSATAATLAITEGVSLSTNGDLLSAEHFGANKVGGETGERKEWILKQGEEYIIKISSEAVSNDVSWLIDCYEE